MPICIESQTERCFSMEMDGLWPVDWRLLEIPDTICPSPVLGGGGEKLVQSLHLKWPRLESNLY